MTTIIGIENKDGVILAADSLATDIRFGKRYKHAKQPKISQVREYLIAGSGMSYICDIAQNAWIPPTPTTKDKKDLLKFMISKAMPSLRQVLRDAGYQKTPPEQAQGEMDFTLLIALNGELFEVDDDLGPLKTQDGIYAIGSGSNFALGALKAGASWQRALEIACEMSVFSEPPFTIKTQKKK